jgi:hypothetical protein
MQTIQRNSGICSQSGNFSGVTFTRVLQRNHIGESFVSHGDSVAAIMLVEEYSLSPAYLHWSNNNLSFLDNDLCWFFNNFLEKKIAQARR